MKTRKTFGSVRGSSIRNLRGGMYLLAVLTLGVLGSGCGGGTGPGNWYGGGPQCSTAVAYAQEPGEDFTGCILNNAILNSTDFSFADFDGAELTGAIFYLPSTSPPRATLIGTKFTNVSAQDVDFTNADLTQADFRASTPSASYLRYAVFNGADLVEARMDEADLRNAKFRYATLDCANLQGADLRLADFTGASLVNADFSYARLSGAVFDAADVDGACFTGASGVVFTVSPDPDPTFNVGSIASYPDTCVPFP